MVVVVVIEEREQVRVYLTYVLTKTERCSVLAVHTSAYERAGVEMKYLTYPILCCIPACLHIPYTRAMDQWGRGRTEARNGSSPGVSSG